MNTSNSVEDRDDSLGHRLFEKRLSECSVSIKKMMETPVRTEFHLKTKKYVVTGIGSSEAHARFFVDLINRYTEATALFVPLISFYKPVLAQREDVILVVMSQGLSPNAQLAIECRRYFNHLILFTAQNCPENQIVEKLIEEKQTIIRLPIESEKNLLIRIIGPLSGYLGIIQFINYNWNHCIPDCNENLVEVLNNIETQKIDRDFFLSNLNKNIVLLTGSPLLAYNQNLAYKLLEGLLLPMPANVDYLTFVHGTFQQMVKEPKFVIVLKQNTASDDELALRAEKIIEKTKSGLLEIKTDLSPPYDIIGYEMIFNYLILAGMKEYKIDQINWPGKDLDGELYNICI